MKLLPSRSRNTCTPIEPTSLWAETLEDRILLSTVQLIAAGSEGGEVMSLQLGGAVVQSWVVGQGADTRQFQTYQVVTQGNVTADQVRISFSNDLYDPANGVDRNLRVDAIIIDGVRYETEAPNVFSTGSWLPQDGVQPGNRQSEYLQANGYFQYSGGGGSGSTIRIAARGDEGGEQFRLWLGNQVVATYTTTTNQQTFTYQAPQTVAVAQVRIEFFNDNYAPAQGIDTNLVVDFISIDGVVYQTEAPTTYSTGSWLASDGIQPGFRRSETLNAAGYFQYAFENSGSIIDVRARGDEGAEQFSLAIDGVVVANYSATTSDQAFSYRATDVVSPQQVRITFLNDAWDPAGGIDNNLIVDYISIDGVIYQTEAPSVYSTGTWLAADGVVSGFRQNETLHVSGYFQYGQATQNDPFDLNGQQVFQYEERLYLRTNSALSWTAAQAQAESLGGNLVTINDAAEQAWLRQTFGSSPLWIGVNDSRAEGVFEWVSGEAVTYTNWAGGAPSNGASSDYVRMNAGTNGVWGDTTNDQSFFGVIEIGQGGAMAQQPGLLGEYYDDLNFAATFGTRVDPIIDFRWNGSALPGMGVENFSVRWTGQIVPEFSETYTFRTLSDDGVRLWVNGQLLIDQWQPHLPTYHTGTIALQAGQRYDIRLELYELSGDAVIRLEWSSPSQVWELVPADRMFASTEPSLNPNGTGFETDLIASGLVQPVAFAIAPDGRIFVTEKAGRVRVIQNGQIVSTFLDIRQEVQSGGDRGLLGIALDPDFANNGYVYLNFTEETNPNIPDDTASDSDAAGRLIRISASASNPNVADLASRVDVLTGHQMTHATHSVGDVDFDNQGNLIFTWGDGGFDANLRLAAQDPNSKQGKLFRINRFTFEGVPDNPYYDPANPNSTASKVWAVGIRNSWKLTVDRATGDVYLGEVTDRGPEEVNVMRADGSTILNFGWPYYEDNIRTAYGTVPANFSYERAFVALPHTDAGGGDAIVGGALYRGTAYPEAYDGRYFFANLNQGILYTAGPDGAYQPFGSQGAYAGVVDIQVGPDGHIWMLNLFTGKIERLVSSNPGNANTSPIARATATRTAGTPALPVTFNAAASTDGDGDALLYAWDFESDGTIDAGGVAASHTYNTLGRHVATLIVTDGQGGVDSRQIEIDVVATADSGNFAFGRPTTQSGVQGDAVSSRAVDGNLSGLAGSFAQTLRTRTPLWEVDLGLVRNISQIQIYLPPNTLLSDYWILVSDSPFSSGNLDAARNDPGVWTYQNTGSASGQVSIPVSVQGRFVRIQLAGADAVLSLAEVRVV